MFLVSIPAVSRQFRFLMAAISWRNETQKYGNCLFVNIKIKRNLADCRKFMENYYYSPCYHLHVGCYNYIPDINHVSRAYSVAEVLYLQFIMLFRPWNIFCNFTLALSVVCVQSQIWLLFLYFLNFVLSSYVAEIFSEWFWNRFQSPLILPIPLLL